VHYDIIVQTMISQGANLLPRFQMMIGLPGRAGLPKLPHGRRRRRSRRSTSAVVSDTGTRGRRPPGCSCPAKLAAGSHGGPGPPRSSRRRRRAGQSRPGDRASSGLEVTMIRVSGTPAVWVGRGSTLAFIHIYLSLSDML
jgi:hypothetical protein